MKLKLNIICKSSRLKKQNYHVEIILIKITDLMHKINNNTHKIVKFRIDFFNSVVCKVESLNFYYHGSLPVRVQLTC